MRRRAPTDGWDEEHADTGDASSDDPERTGRRGVGLAIAVVLAVLTAVLCCQALRQVATLVGLLMEVDTRPR